MEKFDSTSDERTQNSTTRQQYRVLTDEEKAAMDWLKGMGDGFIRYCRQLSDSKPAAGREFSLAITHMEDAVMRAVRGVTQ